MMNHLESKLDQPILYYNPYYSVCVVYITRYQGYISGFENYALHCVNMLFDKIAMAMYM